MVMGRNLLLPIPKHLIINKIYLNLLEPILRKTFLKNKFIITIFNFIATQFIIILILSLPNLFKYIFLENGEGRNFVNELIFKILNY
jgi:hypothetical protein